MGQMYYVMICLLADIINIVNAGHVMSDIITHTRTHTLSKFNWKTLYYLFNMILKKSPTSTGV